MSMARRRPTQIEQTSKHWKSRMAVGMAVFLMAAVCFVAAMVAYSESGQPFWGSVALACGVIGFGGICVTLWAKIMAWWEHG